MSFDIRIPIGALFSLLGLLLGGYGLISDPAIYEAHSLGVNINLGWGVIMLVFGLAMFFLARRPGKRPG
jgi:uncharacterized membrane protein YjfL (UPF0719 family)